MSHPPSNEIVPPTVLPWAYPLDEFYAQAGLPLPAIEQIGGEDMPEPYRSLLVHQRDMTPTLEKFHGGKIHVHELRTGLISAPALGVGMLLGLPLRKRFSPDRFRVLVLVLLLVSAAAAVAKAFA